MSEIKRVALNSFEPPKVSEVADKSVSKTIRITVTLPESNEDKCPEYNYKDLLALTKKRSRTSKESNGIEENGLDPFADNDDDVRRIALEMEAKYGYAGKKKKKGRRDDYADIGLGYDESDSFIDNTDGYDEIIPQNVTTLHGGFYINCGALEFKTDDEASPIEEDESSSSDSGDDDSDIRPGNRKRVIESSEEDSEEESTVNTQAEKKPKLSKNTMQLAIKKQLFSQNKIQVKKRRPVNPLKKTVKELLKEKRVDHDAAVTSTLKVSEEALEKSPENKIPAAVSASIPMEEDYDKNQNKQNVSAIVESTNKINIEPPAQPEAESSQDGSKGEPVRELVLLPENLDPDTLEVVNKIKQKAIDYKGEGKIKFFSDEVNMLLLSLERKCKNLGKASRIKVYEHVSYFIKCKRETLIRRAKLLLIADEERRLGNAIKRLKDIVDQTLPPLVAKYETECAIVLQKKFSENEENRNLKLPRRRFHWTEDAKKTLKEIMSIKRKICLLEGKQKDNLEDQFVTYMKTSLIPLWPEGWMYLNTLKKVHNSMMESKLPANGPASTSHSNHSLNNSSTKSEDVLKGEIASKSTQPKVADTKSSKPSKTTNNNISRPHTENSKEKNSVNMFLKKNEVHDSQMDNSFAELLKSISTDWRKEKSGKQSEDSSQVENRHKDQDEQKDKSKDPSENKPRDFVDHKDKAVTSDISKLKHNEKSHSYSKTKLDEKSSKILASCNVPTDLTNPAKYNQPFNLSNHPEPRTYSRPVQNEKTHIDKKLLPETSKIDHTKSAEPLQLTNHIETINAIGQTELIKLPSDSSVIVINTHQNKESQVINKSNPSSSSKSKDMHCQLLDLTEKNKNRGFNFNCDEPRKEPMSTGYFSSPDIFSSPTIFGEAKKDMMAASLKGSKAEVDDVQMVMENLKALQKLSSSPIKSDSSTGSPVSVIAFNKNFSSKSNSGSNMQRPEKGDSSGGFQEEFQKQFINSLQNMAANASNSSSKSNYRCS